MNRPVHFEILGNNPQALVEFYSQVFGWKVSSWEGPQQYWLAETGADHEPGINGGFMHKRLGQSVINTIEVSSLEDTLDLVEKAGGKKIMGPNQIPGVGRHAYCEDVEGIVFGVLEAEF